MTLFIFAEASNMSAIPFSPVNTQIISYLILVRCKDCSMNDQIYTIYCFCISMGAWNCHFLLSRSMATIIHTEPLNRFFTLDIFSFHCKKTNMKILPTSPFQSTQTFNPAGKTSPNRMGGGQF